MRTAVLLASSLPFGMISGAPGWADTQGFDIEAKAADTGLTIDGLRPMLQSLLEVRFQLKVHLETKEIPIYALIVGKGGPKLKDAKEGGCAQMDPNKLPPPPAPGTNRPPTPCGGFFMGPNMMHGGGVSMTQFVTALSQILGRPVVDQTGLTGRHDVDLEFSPEGTAFGAVRQPAESDTPAPSIFTVVQDQLGLKLESQKGPGKMLVIDRAEKPSEN